MRQRLKLPVGYENFSEIRQTGFYYVDKTKLIEQLLEVPSKVTLFTRPRRFGKTLNMSMLQHFFEVDAKEELFEELYIAQREDLCEKYMGKYPVIFLSLKSVEGLSFSSAKNQFAKLIGMEARRFSFLLNSQQLTQDEKEDYSVLTHKTNGLYTMSFDVLVSSLQTLSQLLYKHYGKKVIILIDEYDVPLDKAFHHGYYEEMVALIRGVLGNALKTNDALQFAVLTGCLRISKESIFTGLNNFRIVSITDTRFDEQFGFTEKEVQQMLSYYGLEEHIDEIREWYDGYHFGNTDVYCPWDVINYVDKLCGDPQGEPESYWINTSGNDLVKRFIDKADKTTRDEIEQLVKGNTIQKTIRLELTYDEIDQSINNLWSVLFTTGYLTQVGKAKEGNYTLKIPNFEIQNVFRNQIQAWFEEKIHEDKNVQKFYKDLQKDDVKGIEKYLNEMLDKTISVFDTKTVHGEKENSYHMFLNGILCANGNWYTRSNVESGDGFADILIETEDIDEGIIIELKHCATYAEMEKSACKALQQIKDKRYETYLKNELRTKIHIYGIAFCKKRCKVAGQTL